LKEYATFRDIQRDLSSGQLSCEALVNSYLQAIRAKVHLNAFLSVYDEEAIRQARIIDTKIKTGTAGPLAGMVIGLKDVLSYKDHPLQASSAILDSFIAQYNATAVQRLLDADAIIIGRQNCDEFGMGSSNENSAFGPVLNAADPARVPGGSSGGSAVAVQAGLCRISIGSDTGGSVRQPAAYCGLVGLKPTYSRISRYGLVAYASSFDCIGILGTCVEDVALILEIIAGADEFDSTVSHKPVPAYSREIHDQHQETYKVAYLKDSVTDETIQLEIRQALTDRIEWLKASGHAVEGIEFPLIEYCLPTYYILATAEASSNLSRYDGVRYGYRSEHAHNLEALYKKSRSEGLGKEVQRRILLGTFVLSARYHDAFYTKAQQIRRLIREQTQEIFRQHDFLLMPVAPTTAFALGEHTSNPLEMYLADLFSVQANVAGVPGISVPCGIDRNNLPVGLQVLANDFDESRLLRFADRLMKMS
jgi:aspartyl-tRNA(Asn)/glutamyl-tRNA(Gln) amidotransferase subunit A